MNGVHRRRVEAGLGQQWRTDPADVIWNYDMTPRARRSGIGVSRGRQSALERDPAGTMSCILDGSDRVLEPTTSNLEFLSKYSYVDVPTGTVAAGSASAPAVAHPAAGATVVLAAEVTPNRVFAGTFQVLMARATNAATWGLRLNSDGSLRVNIGSPSSGAHAQVSSVPVGPLPDRVWYRARLNPGYTFARVLDFEWAPGDDDIAYEDANWTLISSHSINSWGALPVPGNTVTPCYVAGLPGGYEGPVGRLHRAKVIYDGVAAVDLEPLAGEAGDASIVDGAANTWTIGAAGPLVAGDPTVWATTPFDLGVPIRVVDETPDGDVVQFYGFATGWQPTYHKAQASIDVALTAADPLSMTTRAPLPTSVLALEMAADSPKLWHRLAEQAGTVMSDLSGNDLDGSYPAGLTRASTTSPNQFESMPGLAFGADSLGPATLHPGFALTVDPNNDQIEVLLTLGSEPTATHPLIFAWGDGANAFYLGLWDLSGLFGGAPRWNVWWSEGPGTSPTTQLITYANHATFSLLDGVGHHLILDGNSLKIDGVVQGVSSSTVSATLGSLPALASRATLGGSTLAETTFLLDNATLADFAVYSSLSGTRQNVHAAAFLDPWGSDTADDRADRVYDAIGWSPTARDFAACSQVLAPARFESRQKLGDHLDEVVQVAELGRHFARRDGVLVLHNRDWLSDNTEGRAVQLDLVAHPADEDADHYAVATYEPVQDTSKLVNSAVGTGPSGVELSVADEASIAQYGPTDAVDLGSIPAVSDAAARDVLRERVRRYRKPITTLPEVVLHIHRLAGDPVRQAALVEKLNALDLDHRVRVSYDPMGAGEPVVIEATVESIDDWSDDISRTVTLGLSTRFATPLERGVWGRTKWGRSVWAKPA